METLPIHPLLPAIREALRNRGLGVLVAEPGAGKSTVVPLELLGEPWLGEKTILLVEPRRLAARAVAERMARTLGESPGGRVGYRIRGENRCGPETRLEVITEGVLLRKLREDPALEKVGAVLLDEFHERSLQTDLGLALLLQSRELFREDLRLLVMSATLQGERVAELLGDETPLIRSRDAAIP
jgi:ATP-dependent helicase HrpB